MAEKYYGKEKCKVLKEIRKKIAEENDIEYNPTECTHEGDCAGTCPACEAELDYLNRQIDEKRKSNNEISLRGICKGAVDRMAAFAENIRKMCKPTGSIIGDSDSFNEWHGGVTYGDIDDFSDFPDDNPSSTNSENIEPEILIEEKDDLILGRIPSDYGPVSFTISEAKGEQEDDSETDNE